MVLVYGPTETAFTSNGIGAISPHVCRAKEELNGMFELELVHGRDEKGKHLRLAVGNIVMVPTYRGAQPFRLYKVDTDALDVVKAWGRHLFYDLLENIVEDVRPTGATAQEAGDALLAACQYESGFTFESVMTATATAYWIRQNPVACLIGNSDLSMIKRWGGEVERDGLTIRMKSRLGADNGVRIAYRKNLTGLKVTADMAACKTRLMPQALTAENAVLLLPEKYVDSAMLANYPIPRIATLDCKDIQVGTEDYPTEEVAYAAMRARAAQVYGDGLDLPALSMAVEFQDWAQAEEYAGLKALLTVGLGDTVTIDHEPLNISEALRIVRVEYDCLTSAYIALTAGSVRPGLQKTINSQAAAIELLKETTAALPSITEQVAAAESAVLELNKLQANALGLYATASTDPTTGARVFYLHDQEELENSQTIWTMTEAGLAWTNGGWNGGAPGWQYGITSSGNAVMKILSVVGVVADWIQAGELRSATGRISFGLTTEVFRLGAHLLDISTGGLRFTSSQHDEADDYVFKREGGDLVNVLVDGTAKATEAFQWGNGLRAEVRTDTGNEGVDFVF